MQKIENEGILTKQSKFFNIEDKTVKIQKKRNKRTKSVFLKKWQCFYLKFTVSKKIPRILQFKKAERN